MDIHIVKFPLSGEWIAENTPAEQVPSHGTDFGGQTYAYDFVRVTKPEDGLKFFKPSKWRYWTTGVTLIQCLGYGENITAPFDGIVIEAYDCWPERRRLHPFSTLLPSVKRFDKSASGNKTLVPLLGNYLIIQSHRHNAFALLAHFRPGSLKVREQENVVEGQPLAEVGNSGNSTAPHLHFQLMDNADLFQAKGIPCAFRGYECFHEGQWHAVEDALPEKRRLIRCLTNQ